MSSDPCTWGTSAWPCKASGSVNGEYTTPSTKGPDSTGHIVNTNYTITVGGVTIPLVRTARTFKATIKSTYNAPTGRFVGYAYEAGGYTGYAVTECPPTEIKRTGNFTFDDKCTIEKSTLHYLDQRYGVCLYRYQKDFLDLSTTSDEFAGFKVPESTFVCNQAQIKTSDYTANTTVEWRLIKDGVETVLVSDTYELHPFGPKNDGKAYTTGFAAGWVPDPETRLIVLMHQPPSLGIPLTPEIVRLGFYDYGNLPGEESDLNRADGGGKHFYYPEWCRSLQEDPFWKAAAASRYNITWFHTEPVISTTYQPPEIQVDPIPLGSYAKHPVIGEVYQFLIAEKAYNSPDLDKIIQDALPEKVRKTGTTLYSPISLV